MKMLIEELTFDLPAWDERAFRQIHNNIKRLSELAHGKGLLGGMEEICSRLCEQAAMNPGKLLSMLERPRDVRAFTYLMGQRDFLRKVVERSELFDFLASPDVRISILNLRQLIRCFFTGFDILRKNPNALSRLSALIKKRLSDLANPGHDNDLSRMYKARNMVFIADGPDKVASMAFKSGQDLKEIWQHTGLSGFDNCIFQQWCRHRYYIETLKNIPVGSNDPILSQVSKKEVYESAAGNGRKLGHEILDIMIRRSPDTGPSESWLKVILSIAGDPRVNPAMPRYQKWWGLIDHKLQEKARGWLARFDLVLFLEILKEYGRVSGDAAIQRMFPQREIFLKGLIDQGLVSNSRLFVNRKAEEFLRRYYKQKELPAYALVNGQVSIIYLQVGNCHMIEGSHNFSLKIFPQLPPNTEILDYAQKYFKNSDLNQSLCKRFESMVGEPYERITHNGLIWQKKAIDFLRGQGIRLDIEKLLTPSDYKTFKYRYGIR